MEKYYLGKSFNNLEKTLITEILSSKKVYIIAHNDMDFDALASSIALAEICKNYGANTYIISNDNEDKMKDSFKNLYLNMKSKYCFITSEQLSFIQDENDLFIFTDVNSTRRTALKDINISNKTIVIDHHELDKDVIKTDNLFINPKTSSASEILFTVFKKLDIYINRELAQLLLAGIYQDTLALTLLRFPSTLLTITKLFDYGANYEEVKELFKIDFSEKLIINELHENTVFYNYSNNLNNYTIAIDMNTKNQNTIYTEGQLANAVDALLNFSIEDENDIKYNIDAAFILGFIDEYTLAIKSRSKIQDKNPFDVGEIIRLLTSNNGGGSMNRAGTTVYTDNPYNVLISLKELIKQSQNMEYTQIKPKVKVKSKTK